ncbi:MAG: NADH-quinone oxidoreductase subunit NuoG [Anaerolinea sp.]|nr:NADH-quinone oxidoreductase subunit NuoG [Anaerolinea sp.]
MPVKMVNLTIDGQQIQAPEGTLVINAAMRAGIHIPVFCYHPKMEPVGMCRMCLIEVGRPVIDRTTNAPVLEADGTPKIAFAPKLETACTLPVADGLVVRTETQKVKDAHREVVELLLTSHPLDCPICDKGGECPLQNLTMGYGPGQSRFLIDDKMHLEKHVPLGELIFLDRERCIQCARCTRFQREVVDDPVIGFYQRGRSLEIVTLSEPGFDSIFSGNTTDICPVGALTTADFRFGARPWELNHAASICTHCPVGCNLTMDVRREARSSGRTVIKRIMPRQNEAVNEIWICDKGRFVHHYTENEQRLLQPLVRKDGELTAVSWDEALSLVAEKLQGVTLTTLVGGRLANEDLFNLAQLTQALAGQAVLYGEMAGGDLVQQVGLAPGSNLGEVGKGTAILVVASDLHEEAPLWWLRVRQAARRGATLIVLNGRPTRLDKDAQHVLRYAYGSEAQALANFLPGQALEDPAWSAALHAFAQAENVIIFYGSDGLGLEGTAALAQVAAHVLSGYVGRPNNGLVAVWPHGNTQGAWELGFRPTAELANTLRSSGAVYVAAADPAGDSAILAEALDEAGFVVVQELFLTETARRADVVLPVQAYTEREGSFTSGERRVQRFYPANIPALPGPRPDFVIAAQVGQRLGLALEARAASLVFQQMAQRHAAFAGLSYQRLAEVTEQWPKIDRRDLYYGGTSYQNTQGMGQTLALLPLALPPLPRLVAAANASKEGALRILPINRLYDRGALLRLSPLLAGRMAAAALWLHPTLAAAQGLVEGQRVAVELNGRTCELEVRLDENLPVEAAFLPRSVV